MLQSFPHGDFRYSSYIKDDNLCVQENISDAQQTKKLQRKLPGITQPGKKMETKPKRQQTPPPSEERCATVNGNDMNSDEPAAAVNGNFEKKHNPEPQKQPQRLEAVLRLVTMTKRYWL